jgi:DNA-binding MarR family transcriptional regulator
VYDDPCVNDDLRGGVTLAQVQTTIVPGTIALLQRLSKMVMRRTPEELLGMRLRVFVVLSYLADKDGVPQQDLADVLCIDANNLVILLNELESLGYAVRQRDVSDRRRHIVVLTADGRDALRRAEIAREAIEDDILAALDPDERATLQLLLAKALEG